MDELIAQVSARTGLTPDQARQAANVVLEHVKGRVPAPLAAHLDQFLGSGASSGAPSGGLGDIAKDVGGLFNR